MRTKLDIYVSIKHRMVSHTCTVFRIYRANCPRMFFIKNPPQKTPPKIQSNKSLGSVLLVIYSCTNCITTSTVLVYTASKAKVPERICYKQTHGMYTSQELYDSVSTYVRRYLFEQLGWGGGGGYGA